MAGFMSGFGPAFGEALNKSVDRNEKRKDDMFKLTYSKYLENKKERDTQAKADAYAIQRAEHIASVTNQSPEAVEYIARQLRAGTSETQLMKDLEGGAKIQVVQTPDGPKVTGDKVTPASATAPVATDPRDAQTEDAFSKGVEEKVAIEKPSKAPVNIPGPAQPTQVAQASRPQQAAEARNPIMERRMLQAYERIAQVEGKTVEQVRKEMEASSTSPIDAMSKPGRTFTYTPGRPERKAITDNTLEEAAIRRVQLRRQGAPEAEIAEADENYNILKSLRADELIQKANAESGMYQPGGMGVNVFSPDGQYLRTDYLVREGDQWIDPVTSQPVTDGRVVPISKQEQEEKNEIKQSLQKAIPELNKKRTGVTNMLQTVNQMKTIAEKDSRVLTQLTPNVFQEGEHWIYEGATAVKAIKDNLAAGSTVAEAELSRLEAFRQRLEKEGGDTLGALKGMFEVQQALLAFQLAESAGQGGRSLSDEDRKIFANMVNQTITPDRFRNNMSNLILPRIHSVDEEGRLIYDSDQYLNAFKTNREYTPAEFKYQSFEERLKNSQVDGVPQAYQYLIEAAPDYTPPKPVQKTEKTGENASRLIINSPQELEEMIKSKKVQSGDEFYDENGDGPFYVP